MSLAGETVVFTGTLAQVRSAMEAAAKAAGAKVGGDVSKHTTILVAGPGAGSKLAKAKALGTVAVLDEAQWNAKLGGAGAAAGKPAPAKPASKPAAKAAVTKPAAKQAGKKKAKDDDEESTEAAAPAKKAAKMEAKPAKAPAAGGGAGGSATSAQHEPASASHPARTYPHHASWPVQ